MPWSESPLRTLTLPQTAGAGDPRFVIGPDLPAELTAYYGAASSLGGIVAAILYYNSDPDFPNIIQYTYHGFLNDVTPIEAFGFVYNGSVYEQRYDRYIGGSWAEVRHARPTHGLSTNNLTEQDHEFAAPAGTVRFQSSGGVVLKGDMVTASNNTINGQAVTSGTDTTTSATYVNLAGTGSVTSLSFVKRFTATAIEIAMHPTCYFQTAQAGAKFGARVNSVDYDVCRCVPATVNEHFQVSGVAKVAAGLAAGTYTIQARWLRFIGTGTLTRDVNDWFSMSAREVSA